MSCLIAATESSRRALVLILANVLTMAKEPRTTMIHRYRST